MMRKALWMTVFFVVALGLSHAQNLDQLFQWSVSPEQIQVSPGSSVNVEAKLVVAFDHIAYRDMTSFAVQGPDGVTMGEAVFPPAETKVDPTDGETKELYLGTQVFTVPIQVGASVPAGNTELTLVINYQGCSQTLCFFPSTKKIPIQLSVTEGAGNGAGMTVENTPSATPGLTLLSSKGDWQSQLSQGGILTFLIVFFLGFLTSLTPCVYPMIPVTISIFGARNTNSRMQAFSLAATYVFGIAVMYSFLGYLAASSTLMFGELMSNPWVMGGIGLFFVALGISMLGVYDFQLPAALRNRLASVGGQGYSSAFVMGLVLGIVAAPCTGPILAGILAYTAATGNVAYGVSLMFVYALGLGLLFLVLGTYSGAIANLPKSGRWMESVKSIFAIVLFAAALYFIKDAFPVVRGVLAQSAIYYITVIILLAVGIAMGGIHLSWHGTTAVRIRKVAGVVLCSMAVYLFAGSFTVIGESAVKWVKDLDEGLALAKAESKPVVIDFYADWCAICKELDAFTFSKPEVGQALERFVTIKVDIEADPDRKEVLMQEYTIQGLPLIVFIDSQGNRLEAKRIDGFVNADQFIQHIQDIP
ncbi:MAG: protein-disulfide reductase DsbD [bacterium]|jgi:thiol:disulfide interchange protein DsbD|nr:protein-disulfide reductase DsbD [bacterium]